MALASTPAAFQVEVAVVGAGVIGLAIARALAKNGKEVLILDRADAIGSETSSRNSEVIHAGLYYPEDSLKAKFCVEGKQLMYDYCESRHINYNKCGKLIVATQKQQLETQLPNLQQQAIRNGVSDVQMLTPEDVSVLEPSVKCFGALWSPSTGVLDSHSFMLSLLADAEDYGATLALHSSLQSSTSTGREEPEHSQDAIINDTGSAGGKGILLQLDDDTQLECQTVINSAGLWADLVARVIHRNNRSPTNYIVPQQYYAKGNYFRLQGCKIPFQHLVYPLPEPGGLGIHATIDWVGTSVKFGPDVEWISAEVKDPTRIDLRPHPEQSDTFYKEIRKYWPDVSDGSLEPDYAGIRPKLDHPSLSADGRVPFRDYTIVGPEQHGIPGLVHLFAMESPGLTSSMAIGKYIANKVMSWN